MTARTILLTISLLANAALVAAYLIAPAGSPRTGTNAAQTQIDAAHATGPAIPGGAEKASATQPAQTALFWAAIDTQDIDELARRLKAAGFTPEEMRTILGRRIAQLFSSNPAGDAAKSTPYWRPAFRYVPPAGQDAEARRKQMAEQDRLFRKYVNGPDSLADDPDRIKAAQRVWGDLPVEKLQAIATIEADYQEVRMKQYAESRVRPGETSSVDAHRLIEKERLADIAKILTPEEFAAFELRAGPTASAMRFQLETFKASEEEYKTIFAITKAYEDRRWDTELNADARKALAAEITAKVKDALGADRALDYDAAVNQNSQDQTARIVSRLGLPARVAAEIRQTQTDFTQRAKDIRANTVLGPNERDAQLAALAAQAQAQLTAKLGADGFEAYNDVKGDWLRALKPKSGP